MLNLAENIKDEVKEEAKPEAEVKEEAELEDKKKAKKEKKTKEQAKIEKLEGEIKGLTEEVAKWKNEYLKAYAEMENYKKRTNDEAIKNRKYASQHVIGELIQPVDMLTQVVNMPAPSPEIQNYLIGFQMITNQLVDVLKAEGLAPVEALNKEFDPKNMQAVETVNEPDKDDNIVVKVMQPGYMYKDRVLRPAMVVVNKKEIKEEKKEEE